MEIDQMAATQSLIELTEQTRSVIESVYAAVKAGDIDTLFAHCADDILLLEPPFLPFGRRYHGKEEFLQLFPAINYYLDVSKTKVYHLVVDGERAVGSIGMPDRKTGKFTQMLEHFTLRNGRVAEIQLFYYDAGTMIQKIDETRQD